MISQSEKTNPISERPKMNVNAFSQKDYENETAFRLPKNKPKQTQFLLPLSSALCPLSSVLCPLSSAFCFCRKASCGLSSVHGHLLVNRMKTKLLNFLLRIRKKPVKTPANC